MAQNIPPPTPPKNPFFSLQKKGYAIAKNLLPQKKSEQNLYYINPFAAKFPQILFSLWPNIFIRK